MSENSDRIRFSPEVEERFQRIEATIEKTNKTIDRTNETVDRISASVDEFVEQGKARIVSLEEGNLVSRRQIDEIRRNQ